MHSLIYDKNNKHEGVYNCAIKCKSADIGEIESDNLSCCAIDAIAIDAAQIDAKKIEALQMDIKQIDAGKVCAKTIDCGDIICNDLVYHHIARINIKTGCVSQMIQERQFIADFVEIKENIKPHHAIILRMPCVFAKKNTFAIAQIIDSMNFNNSNSFILGSDFLAISSTQIIGGEIRVRIVNYSNEINCNGPINLVLYIRILNIGD